ncbi:hypothetical protein T484DRAFT_3537057, partial [Baffinella frigidus]
AIRYLITPFVRPCVCGTAQARVGSHSCHRRRIQIQGTQVAHRRPIVDLVRPRHASHAWPPVWTREASRALAHHAACSRLRVRRTRQALPHPCGVLVRVCIARRARHPVRRPAVPGHALAIVDRITTPRHCTACSRGTCSAHVLGPVPESFRIAVFPPQGRIRTFPFNFIPRTRPFIEVKQACVERSPCRVITAKTPRGCAEKSVSCLATAKCSVDRPLIRPLISHGNVVAARLLATSEARPVTEAA